MGASITSNYGLATEFNDNYAAGIYGGKTDLQTINLNLSGAYRLNNSWSFGLGFDAVYAKAKIERYAGSLGPLLSQQLIAQGVPASLTNGINTPDSQIAHLKGDEWGFGWNAGILYELDKDNRWGLTYRSEVKIDFEGDYKSSINPNLNNILGSMGLPYGTMGATQNGSLTLNLPEMWEISGYNRVAPQWAIHYSMAYTSWSQFQELKAKAIVVRLCSIKMKDSVTHIVSRWVQPTITIKTGPSVPVSPMTIAQFRPINVLFLFLTRIACG